MVKGGRRFSFNALVVVGDGNGRVAAGYGKANEVPPAVDKATKDAQETMKRRSASRCAGDTIPHRVIGKFGASRVILVPAGPGTGVKAGPGVRDVLVLCGMHNILTKVHGSTNPINLVKATIAGLMQLRTRQEVAALRGVTCNGPEQPVHEGVHKHRPKKRVGRGIGSGHGKTSHAAAPRASGPAPAPGKPTFTFEGGQMPLFRRMPKRGFNNATWEKNYHVVNVGDLDAHFKDGDVVDPEGAARLGWPRARPTASASWAMAS